MEPRATFTTLKVEDRLRGCCGALEATHPLATDVALSAFKAAFRDPRFNPVIKAELDVIRLEVSVLSPMEPFPVTDEADLLHKLTPGMDGIVIVAGERRATFLPKVWEMLPDPRRFLAALKSKCGLPESYWSEQLEFLRYRTMSFAESIEPAT
jgi:AmmeMemoRadiSam system protein A